MGIAPFYLWKGPDNRVNMNIVTEVTNFLYNISRVYENAFEIINIRIFIFYGLYPGKVVTCLLYTSRCV